MEILSNARVVIADRVIENGSVTIEDGRITEVSESSGGEDLGGRYLLPGLVDLHCDAIEKIFEPRPGVMMPMDYALEAADRMSLAAGILTPFYSLSFSENELGTRNPKLAAQLVRGIVQRRDGLLTDGRIHCRYEITDKSSHALLAELIEEGTVDLISFMDHTPGQGQFHSIEAYSGFLSKNYHYSDEQIRKIIDRKYDARESGAERVAALAAQARKRDIPMAGHDDDSPERIRLMSEMGATISEFPVNEPTARAARDCGLGTVFGAPNLVRGASQSGNIKALDAVRADICDALCADYVPSSMLVAAFRIPEWTGWTLPQAVALVAGNPARLGGMRDRGEIKVGLRADLIAVEIVRGVPQVTSAWVQGRKVFQTVYPAQVLERA